MSVSLSFREAQDYDAKIIYEWFCDPVTRSNSYQQEPVSYSIHEAWFYARIRRSGEPFLIFYLSEQPDQLTGMVRIDLKNEGPVIGINLAPEQRGKGYASEMLRMAVAWFYQISPDAPPLRAWIMKKNIASQRAFISAGFVADHDAEIAGIPSSLFLYHHP